MKPAQSKGCPYRVSPFSFNAAERSATDAEFSAWRVTSLGYDRIETSCADLAESTLRLRTLILGRLSIVCTGLLTVAGGVIANWPVNDSDGFDWNRGAYGVRRALILLANSNMSDKLMVFEN